MNSAVAGLARSLRELEIALAWLETGLILVLFSALVLLGLAMTPALAGGLYDPATARGLISLVLTWLLMLGSVRAVSRYAHPGIGLARISGFPPGRTITSSVLALMAGVVCFGLAWAGWKLLLLDLSLGSSSHGSVPAWPALVAFPIGFALMAARFLSRGMQTLVAIMQPRSDAR